MMLFFVIFEIYNNFVIIAHKSCIIYQGVSRWSSLLLSYIYIRLGLRGSASYQGRSRLWDTNSVHRRGPFTIVVINTPLPPSPRLTRSVSCARILQAMDGGLAPICFRKTMGDYGFRKRKNGARLRKSV